MRKVAVVCFGLILCSSAAASAAPFAAKGTTLLGGENLSFAGGTKTDTNTIDTGATYVTLLGNVESQSPFDLPRLGFDLFVLDRLTIGGSLTFAHLSTERTVPIVGRTESGGTTFVISPRAGYAMMLGSFSGLWLRAGVTYYHWNQDDSGDLTASGFALNIDPTLLLFPNDYFAVGVTPTFGVPLSGSVETGGNSTDLKFSTYGISLGIYGVL